MAISKITNDGIGDIDELTVDTDTLVVDSTNNQVGIGTTSPNANLGFPIGSDIKISQVAGTAHQSGNAGSIGLTISDGGNHSGVFVNNSHDGTYSDQFITFNTAEGGVSSSTERMRIDSSGQVGIGTTSPEGTLHVENASNNSLIMDAPANRFNSIGFQTAGVDKWWLGRADSDQISGDAFFIGIDNGNVTDAGGLSNKLAITQSGNVGIGTSSPDGNSQLHIKKTGANAKITLETDESNDCYINFSGATSEASIGYEPTANSIVFSNAADGLTSNERMRIDSSGNVGINTSSPSADLHVIGSCFFDTYLDSSGSWQTRKKTNLSLSSFASGANPTYDWNSAVYSFKFTNYNNCLAITVGGTQNNRQANIQVGHSSPDIYAQYYGSLYLNKLGGTVYANTSSISDERYKTNLETVEDSLNKVTSLNGYTFYRTDVNTDLQQAGVIAQQVQEVFPCAVVYDEDEDKYAVSYDMLSALYIEAFKELKTKVETLETENQEQATQISDLLNRVAALEAN